MNNNSVYTRKIKGLDRKVWLVMILTIVLSLGLLSYSVINKKECIPVEFAIKVLSGERSDTTYFVGETLFFKSSTTATVITWDFNDGSEQAIGRNVTHKFRIEGDYIITVSTGLGCENARRITVKKAVQTETKPLAKYQTGGEIEGPGKIMAGREARYICIVSADHYEWSIENLPLMTRTGSTAKFIFPRPGKYFVQVMLDNDPNKRFGKEIEVGEASKDDGSKPKVQVPKIIDEPFVPYKPTKVEPVKDTAATTHNPTPTENPRPTPPKSKMISDQSFEAYLTSLIAKEMNCQDFDKYLCGGGGTPVVANGDKKDFAWLCNELPIKKKSGWLSSKKNAKIKRAHLNYTNNCVVLIEVEYYY